MATTVSAHDVARELAERLTGIGEVKLHKLLYYCQGWHLAFTGAPMFSEDIQAWGKGPVVKDIWRDRKYPNSYPVPDPRPLDTAMLGTVGYVLSRYGSHSGIELVRLTHTEAPWRDASERVGDFEYPDEPITNEALIAFFGAEKQADPVHALAQEVFANEGLRREFAEADAAMRARPPVTDTLDALEALAD